MSGTGKTLLTKKIGERLQQHYEVLIWRSLADAPKLNELAADLLYGMKIASKNANRPLSQLIEQMRSRRCLIVLDGLELILQSQALNGQYAENYTDYDNFVRAVGGSSHQSCVITTS